MTSLTKYSDTTATLIFTVDSKGVSVEDMDLNGTIALAAGTLQSRWGDSTADASSYTRSYENESMGKDFPLAPGDALTYNDLENIQSIVGGFGNTAMGTLTSSVSGIASAASGAVTLLELTGVIESEKVKLDKIYKAVQALQEEVTEINAKLDMQNGKNLAQNVYNFYTKSLMPLLEYCKYAQGHYRAARREVLGVDSNNNVKEPTTAEEFKAVWKVAAAIGINLGTYGKLLELWTSITSSLMTTGVNMNNPINYYDSYMKNIYNFDTQTYKIREEFGTMLAYGLTQCAAILTSYAEYGVTYDEDLRDNISATLDLFVHGMPESGKLSDIQKQAKDGKPNGILTNYLLSTKPRGDGKLYCYVNNRSFYQKLAWVENFYWAISHNYDNRGGYDDWKMGDVEELYDRLEARGKTWKSEFESAGITLAPESTRDIVFFKCWTEGWTSGGLWPWEDDRMMANSVSMDWAERLNNYNQDHVYDTFEQYSGKNNRWQSAD